MRDKRSRRTRGSRFAAIMVLALGVAWTLWKAVSPGWRTLPAPTPESAAIVEGARRQIGDIYDASYRRIPYPGGDVRAGRGACTDVVVRSFRHAGFDLQALVHEDMARHFTTYPDTWGLQKPDPNIDHRRVPNLMRFFTRKGVEVTEPEWSPGDVVCWRMPSGQMHIGVVSDRATRSGRPLVIHNNGVCREEDALDRWPVVGHYRYPPREAETPRTSG